uniref:coiled-coil domain-containing protein 169 isoform X3 n=1 Tax=Maylandia zebra TaxID=106582 RepID=UPI000647F91D|nr:coiled-coil domain-containing protein 169 isoform X3 [Maylandia zebra]
MAKASEDCKYALARLQVELEKERGMKEMLEESVSDLRSTTSELQERLHSVDGEGNEWRTRYETQVELNGQLERQISLIRERLEDIRGNPVDRLASIRSYEDMPVAFHKTNDERRAYLSEIAKLSSTHEAQRRQYFAQPQRAPESKQMRGKQTGRKAEADSKKGKEGGEEDGGEAFVKERGGGDGGRIAERKGEKKLQRKSRLPTLKHNPKHDL